MKTAKEILYEKAAQYKDGFLSGQVKWLIEAMNDYAKQTPAFSKEDYDAGYDKGYADGFEDANHHSNTPEWSV